VLGIVKRKHEGGVKCTSGNKECQRGTLTARYAMFSVQCSIQNTVQCTLYSTVFDKNLCMGGVHAPNGL
jgi:hypothetical protein